MDKQSALIILGIKILNKDNLKIAHRAAQKKFHPDIFKDNGYKFREITEANEFLEKYLEENKKPQRIHRPYSKPTNPAVFISNLKTFYDLEGVDIEFLVDLTKEYNFKYFRNTFGYRAEKVHQDLIHWVARNRKK